MLYDGHESCTVHANANDGHASLSACMPPGGTQPTSVADIYTNIRIYPHGPESGSTIIRLASRSAIIRTSSSLNPYTVIPPQLLMLTVLCFISCRNYKILQGKPHHVTRFLALAQVGNPDKKKRVS